MAIYKIKDCYQIKYHKNIQEGGGKYWELPCKIITFEIFFFKGWEIHQPVANFLDYFFIHRRKAPHTRYRN